MSLDTTIPTVDQGAAGSVASPWAVRLSDGAAFYLGASQADVQAVRDRLPAAFDADGGLKVHMQSAHGVTDNGGSFTVDAPVGTPVFTRLSDGAAALIGQKAMAASLPVAVASDQSSLPTTEARLPAALDADGGVKVHAQSAIPVTDNAGSLTVDGTVTADTELEAAAALADASANPTTPRVGAAGLLWNGATWDRAPGNTSGEYVQGAIASGAADSGNPVKVGGKYNLTNPIFVDGNRADIQLDSRGQQKVVVAEPGGNNFASTSNPTADAAAALRGLVVVPENMLFNGASWDRMRGDVTNGLDVDVTRMPANYGDVDVDHDAVDTAKVSQIGGYASPVDVPPTNVSANGDRVRAWFNKSGAQIMRRAKIATTYTAVYRLAEAAARLDQTFTLTANTNKQWATLHHAATATKEIRLQLVIVWVTSATAVAPQGIIELRELSSATAPATGNPAITPRPAKIGAAAAEATALYLPTTAGSEAAVNSPVGHYVTDEAVSVATAAFQHPQGYGRGGIRLYDASELDDECMPPTAPVGVYGGWAIMSRFTGATVLRLTAMMVFTEETP